MRTLSAAICGAFVLLFGSMALLSTASIAGAGVDVTPPVVELVGPAEGAVVAAADLAEVECVATDNVKVDGRCVIDFIEKRSENGLEVSVTATASDRKGNSASATSSFVLLFDPVPLTVVDDRAIGLVGSEPIVIDVLANDLDADDDLDASTLTILNGAAEVDSDGVVLFEPLAAGSDSFSYEVCDSMGACDTGMVVVMVLDETDCTIVGTDGDDDLVGTNGADVICGFGGDDVIHAMAGSDIVFAGSGDDEVTGGPGADVLFGGSGNDAIRGSAGSDFLDGGAGDDLLKGENHADTVFGNVGNDELHGGRGNDVVAGGAGDDHAFGWDGRDLVTGGRGADIVRGGSGDDELRAGPGDDFLHGEGGDDTLVGGEGFDIGDAGKQDDQCASLEQRLRCDRYGVSVDTSTQGEGSPELPELPPAEHDADDEDNIGSVVGQPISSVAGG